MKKIIGFIFFILLFQLTYSQNIINKDTYQDLGVWNVKFQENNLSLSAFIKIYETSKKEKDVQYLSLKNKKTKNFEIVETIYRHELYLKSNSVIDGDTTNTWIYNVRVYIDDVEITKDQFPNGFILLIKTEPTLIYWYDSPEQNVNMYIKWEKAVYENRNYKK